MILNQMKKFSNFMKKLCLLLFGYYQFKCVCVVDHLDNASLEFLLNQMPIFRPAQKIV